MNHVCNICKNKKFSLISKKVRDSSNHKIIKCSICQHIQISPIPSYEENRKFYDENKMSKNLKMNSINKIRQKFKFDTDLNVQLIQKIATKKDKILEIGSGYGFFLDEMEKKGYDITGVELSKVRRNHSKKITEAPVFDYDLTKTIPDFGKFNIILLFGVMEYIADPIQFLSNLREMIENKGKIVIISPNVNDLQLKLNEHYRNWFWQRAHINYFKKENLKFVLKKAKFKKIAISGIQRYSFENMIIWKLTHKPQLENPSHTVTNEYEFLDKYYKKILEQKLICDTLFAIAEK